jgi:hypothetical protein
VAAKSGPAKPAPKKGPAAEGLRYMLHAKKKREKPDGRRGSLGLDGQRDGLRVTGRVCATGRDRNGIGLRRRCRCTDRQGMRA